MICDCLIAVVPSSGELVRIRQLLSREGITVWPANSLAEAVQRQEAVPAPVILYDMDTAAPWREALVQFLRQRPAAKVIFLSRLADMHLWIDVLDAGGYDLLVKPFEAPEIRCVVRNALSAASPTHSLQSAAARAA